MPKEKNFDQMPENTPNARKNTCLPNARKNTAAPDCEQSKEGAHLYVYNSYLKRIQILKEMTNIKRNDKY